MASDPDPALEDSLRRLRRSLTFIKVMMGVFFIMLLAGLLILGFIAYKVVTFSRHVDTKINNIQHTTSQKLDLKSQLCNGQVFNPTVTAQLCR